MRKYIVAATASLIIWSGAVLAQATLVPPEVSFRDIFNSLITKVKQTSDQVFFESAVLPAGAKKEAISYAPGSYQYSYGPELSGMGSTYGAYEDEKGAHITFQARDFSDRQPGGCISFKEAQTKLHAQGWIPISMRSEHVMPGDVNVSEHYQRAGVTLTISLFEHLMPFPEPWNSAEFNNQGRDDAIKEASKLQNIHPGTDAYERRCITSLGIEIIR